MNRTRIYWTCQVGGWLAYAGVNQLLFALFGNVSAPAVASSLVLSAVGLGLTHAFRAFVRRRGWVQMSLGRLVPRVLLASVGMSLCVQVFFFFFYQVPLWRDAFADYQIRAAAALFVNLSFLFLLWSLVYFGLHYFWNYRAAEVERWRLQAAVKDAELAALRAQVNPHFLFNSLNSIRALIVEDPARAQQVVTQLAALLRYTLQAGATSTVPLEAELHAVRTYLALESIRLEERLRYTIDVDDAVRQAPVPPMLVQTLVENGIKHGVATRVGGGTVAVTATRRNGAAHVCVTSTGRLAAAPAPGGVGLRNATERLRLLFGDAAALSLRTDGPDAVTAEVVIPLAG